MTDTLVLHGFAIGIRYILTDLEWPIRISVSTKISTGIWRSDHPVVYSSGPGVIVSARRVKKGPKDWSPLMEPRKLPSGWSLLAKIAPTTKARITVTQSNKKQFINDFYLDRSLYFVKA